MVVWSIYFPVVSLSQCQLCKVGQSHLQIVSVLLLLICSCSCSWSSSLTSNSIIFFVLFFSLLFKEPLYRVLISVSMSVWVEEREVIIQWSTSLLSCEFQGYFCLYFTIKLSCTLFWIKSTFLLKCAFKVGWPSMINSAFFAALSSSVWTAVTTFFSTVNCNVFS